MSALLALFLLLALGVPLLLYVFIQQETADPEIMDRSEAERLARERGGRPGTGRDRDDPDEWGAESRRERDSWE